MKVSLFFGPFLFPLCHHCAPHVRVGQSLSCLCVALALDKLMLNWHFISGSFVRTSPGFFRLCLFVDTSLALTLTW